MKPISQLMRETIDQKEILRGAEAQRAMREWATVVGETLATHTLPERFDHGVLWVAASGSAWAQELRLRRETVVARLNEIAGESDLFTDIRVGTRKPRSSPADMLRRNG